MEIVPVILAGGIGERFWPFSRSSSPKQLLPLISKRSMIKETFGRVSTFCRAGTRPLIVTGAAMAAKIKKALPPGVGYDVIAEPVGKNTAPAIAIAAGWIGARYGNDAVMIVLSADHAISPQKDFIATVNYAVDLASSLQRLIVFGIYPSRPDTGYGYIQIDKQIGSSGDLRCFQVRRFVEKPTPWKADMYLASGKYLWNSGMFVWNVSVILEEFRSYMPLIYRGVVKASRAGFTRAAVGAFYRDAVKESIDYGIMERSERVAAVKGNFLWDDLGSWEALGRVLPSGENRTVRSGKRIYEKECVNAIVANNSSLTVAAIGLTDTVVAVVDDAVLVIARDKLPAMKKYLAELKGDPAVPKKLF
jgi:mannose-1-phosphate guanylyltransferase